MDHVSDTHRHMPQPARLEMPRQDLRRNHFGRGAVGGLRLNLWRLAVFVPAMLATGGGLLFTGKETGEFIAVDVDTGKVVWQKRLRAAGSDRGDMWSSLVLRIGQTNIVVFFGVAR